MPQSSKERSKRWRDNQKLSPTKHALYLQKEKERYQRRKEKREIVPIAEKSEKEQRKVRRNWRKNQRQRRKNLKEVKATLNLLQTPPNSPEEGNINAEPRSRKQRGRRQVRRDRSKLFRENQKLKIKLCKSKNMYDKFRQKAYRLKIQLEAGNSESPRKQTDKQMKSCDNKIRKVLLFHNTLVASIKEKYKSSTSEKRKQLLCNIVTSNLMRHYKLIELARMSLGFSNKRIKKKNRKQEDWTEFHHAKKANKITEEIKKRVKHFLLRDDCSRIKAGKKETITRMKIKKQKRLLNDSMKNLHTKFLSENPDITISYSLFCRLRPFWVLSPVVSDRETCMCKTHANLSLKAEKLHHLKLIRSIDVMDLAREICCNTENKTCMYRECSKCKGQNINISVDNPGLQTTWNKWVTNRYDRERKSTSQEHETDTVKVSITEKITESGTLETLVDEFNKELSKACRHFYNIHHQYKSLRFLRESLGEHDVVIHMDFSENWTVKYHAEIQSMHFGASKKQITLHTGIIYTKDKTVPFCSISDSRKHNPAGIWGHTLPVLTHCCQELVEGNVKRVHFITDGPTTQYRSKTNFLLFSTQIFNFGISEGYWNFLEAGHGKGPADGIGAVIKRTADKLVADGKDITSAQQLMDALNSNTTVKLFLIQEEEINKIESSIPEHMTAIPNTMKLHQLYTNRRGQIYARFLSCYCNNGTFCDCYMPMCYEMNTVSSITNISETDSKAPELSHGQLNIAASENLSSSHVELDESAVSKWCLVLYDGNIYPGIINDVDVDDIEVKVMHKIGRNRYFWPTPIEDVLWYTRDKFLCFINEPKRIGTRHFEIEKSVWEQMAKVYDIN